MAHQPPLSTGFSRQEHWNRLPFSSPRDPPDPEIVPGSPALQADYLPFELSHKLFSCNIIWLNHEDNHKPEGLGIFSSQAVISSNDTVITAHIHRALITLLGHSNSLHLSFGGVITGNPLTGEEADAAQGYVAIRQQIQDSSPDALATECWFVNHAIPADTRAQTPVGLWLPVREWSSGSWLALVYIVPVKMPPPVFSWPSFIEPLFPGKW